MARTVFLITWIFLICFLLVIGSPFSVAAIAGVVPAAVAGGVTWFGLRGRRRDDDTKAPTGPQGKKPLTVTEQSDGWTVIDAHPAPLPAWTTVAPILVGFLAAWTTVALSGSFRSVGGMLFTGAAVWAGVGGVIYLWAHANNNARRHLQKAAFAVSAEAVRLPDGMVIPASRILAVMLRNGMDGELAMTVTHSIIGTAASMAHARHQSRLAAISYRVDVEHEGRSTTLAGGLTETQARAVGFEVVQRVRGLA